MDINGTTFKRIARSTTTKVIAGIAVGVGATILYFESKTLLEITPQDAKRLKTEANFARYDTQYGPIFVGATNPEDVSA